MKIDFRWDIMRFNKGLYPKIALIKAAYNFTDVAYLHLDCDDQYYFVDLKPKPGCPIVTEEEFNNEILTQSVRHFVYSQTKNIRELMLARALSTSLVSYSDDTVIAEPVDGDFDENAILKEWFSNNEDT